MADRLRASADQVDTGWYRVADRLRASADQVGTGWYRLVKGG